MRNHVRNSIILISIICAVIFIHKKEQLYIYENFALGTKISIQLYHHNRRMAEDIALKAFEEVRRLENIFSLYIDNSDISILNKQGYINNPPPELVELINITKHYSKISGGVYDITIQSLWKETNGNIGYQHIIATSDKIYFNKPNMQITLNSAAQGYITDKITEMLIENNITKALVDIGEIRAIGDGWNIQIKKSNKIITLNDESISTSAGYGMKRGDANHLINPQSGNSPPDNYSVTVIAPQATIADILSTAIALGANIPPESYSKLITINVTD